MAQHEMPQHCGNNTEVCVGKSRTGMDNRHLIINVNRRQRRGLEAKSVLKIENSWITFI